MSLLITLSSSCYVTVLDLFPVFLSFFAVPGRKEVRNGVRKRGLKEGLTI